MDIKVQEAKDIIMGLESRYVKRANFLEEQSAMVFVR